jgi:hypothetical protein
MKLILAFALVLFTLGCASVVGPPPIDTSQLVAAGFKTVDLETPKQLERLQQLYVGRPAEYQAYLKLTGGTAGPSLAQQSAADTANYAKQDAGMSLLTARDADDPYWWSLDNIGWR